MYLIASRVLALVLVHLTMFVGRIDHWVGVIVHVVLLLMMHGALPPTMVVSPRLAPCTRGMGLLCSCLGDATTATGVFASVAMFVMAL